MKRFQTKLLKNVFILVFWTLISLFTLASHAWAQLSPTYGRPSAIERDMRYQDWVLDRLRQQKQRTPEQLKLAYEQLRQDYEKIQNLNNELLKAISEKTPLDNSFVEHKVVDVRKTALRLRNNLVLPEPPEGEVVPSVQVDEASMEASIRLLDQSIYKFIKNPIFKNVDVIDVQNAIAARIMLDNIVFISEKLKNMANKPKNVSTH